MPLTNNNSGMLTDIPKALWFDQASFVISFTPLNSAKNGIKEATANNFAIAVCNFVRVLTKTSPMNSQNRENHFQSHNGAGPNPLEVDLNNDVWDRNKLMRIILESLEVALLMLNLFFDRYGLAKVRIMRFLKFL